MKNQQQRLRILHKFTERISYLLPRVNGAWRDSLTWSFSISCNAYRAYNSYCNSIDKIESLESVSVVLFLSRFNIFYVDRNSSQVRAHYTHNSRVELHQCSGESALYFKKIYLGWAEPMRRYFSDAVTIQTITRSNDILTYKAVGERIIQEHPKPASNCTQNKS